MVQTNVENYTNSNSGQLVGGPIKIPSGESFVQQNGIIDSRPPRPRTSSCPRSRDEMTANGTFNTFIEDALDNVIACNQASGVQGTSLIDHPDLQKGISQFQGTRQSTNSNPYQAAQQHQLIKQQRMMEQSKALLEQSKAKHQAMVAQAHAAQQMQKQQETGQFVATGDADDGYMEPPSFTPHPPQRPPTSKKPASAHRLAR